MKAFVVALADDQEAFLSLADALAATGVNLTAVALLPGSPRRLGFTVNLEEPHAGRSARSRSGLRSVETSPP